MRLRATDIIPALVPVTLQPDDTEEFFDAWLQLHHLAQVAAEVGKSWGAYREDDSHSAFVVPEDADGLRFPFESQTSDDAVYAGLDLDSASIALELGQDDTSEVVTLFASGRTCEDLKPRVRELVQQRLGPESHEAKPAPDLPDHGVARGDAFTITAEDDDDEEDPTGETHDHYGLTAIMLERFVSAVREIAADGDHELEPRLWPHHFDLASLLVLARDQQGAMTQTIGVGLTPPDSVESSGYWYVSPWSKGDPERPFEKPPLPFGRWVDRGQMAMAVLPIADVWAIAQDDRVEAPGPVQACAVAEFVASAFNACIEGLGK